MVAFQSHFGSIGPPWQAKQLQSQSHLSIPLWFDWTEALVMLLASAYHLSIPLWFDWTRGNLTPVLFVDQSFNPTLVRLDPGLPSGGTPDSPSFNPTLVRLDRKPPGASPGG